MCNIKYILCTIFCMCAYLHAAAICSDSISDKFSYKVLGIIILSNIVGIIILSMRILIPKILLYLSRLINT